MEIARLDSCPKCKGFLMREKDRYGLYEQCMQCGYIHDLQTVGWVDKKQAGEKREDVNEQRVTAECSKDEHRNTPQLNEFSHIEYLTVPPDLQSILSRILPKVIDGKKGRNEDNIVEQDCGNIDVGFTNTDNILHQNGH